MDQPPRLDEQQQGARSVLLSYAGLGAELAGGIVGFLVLGWWIGRAFGADRTGMIIGAAIGCAGGLYNLIRRAVLMQKQEDEIRRGTRDDQAKPRDPL